MLINIYLEHLTIMLSFQPEDIIKYHFNRIYQIFHNLKGDDYLKELMLKLQNKDISQQIDILFDQLDQLK